MQNKDIIDVLERVKEAFCSDIPERNCSCHINPPCSDCVDNSFPREVRDDMEATILELRKSDELKQCLRAMEYAIELRDIDWLEAWVGGDEQAMEELNQWGAKDDAG